MNETARALRERAPLVHYLGPAVTSQRVADALLAAGARPMMTDSAAEAPAMTALADALAVNLGALSADAQRATPLTVSRAVADGRPWVLDPAAIGLAPLRTPLARELLAAGPTIVRANASEVLALAGGEGGRGADSTHDAASPAVADAARRVSENGPVVAVSGPVDRVFAGGALVAELAVGTPLLARVTGTGCALGALMAAGAAVADPITAAVTATRWVGEAGAAAALVAAGPGTFAAAWLDALADWDGSP